MHTGAGGWNLAAMLRSLDLTGITKAREVARPSERLRSVFNTIILRIMSSIYRVGGGRCEETVKGPLLIH